METTKEEKTTANQMQKYFREPEIRHNKIVSPEVVKPQQDMMPKETTNPETLSRIERDIQDLSSEIANFCEMKESLEHLFEQKAAEETGFHDSIIGYFNGIKDGFKEFSERVNKEIDYTRELELKIQNQDYSRQVYLLEKELKEERSKITLFIEDITKHNNSMSALITEALQKLDEKCLELKNADRIMAEEIKKFRDEAVKFTTNEYEAFKINCTTALKSFVENAQKSLEAVKSGSINFLNQCETDNKNIIRKIPKIKDGKFDFHDFITIALGCLGIAGFIAQLFVK